MKINLVFFILSLSFQVFAAKVEQISKSGTRILIMPAPGEYFEEGDRVCVDDWDAERQCGRIIGTRKRSFIVEMDEAVSDLKKGTKVSRNLRRRWTENSGGAWREEKGKPFYVRAKSGLSLYSNTEPVKSTFGFGLDFGYKDESGFGLNVLGVFNLKKGETLSNGSGVVDTDIQSFFVGLSPNFLLIEGPVNLSFGLGVGLLSVSQDVSVTLTGIPTTSVSATSSRFALAPHVQIDFLVGADLFLNMGAQYFLGFGESPKPAFFSPMAGLGVRI